MAGGLTICTEVSKRVGGRFAAADCIQYVNDGMNLACSEIPFIATRSMQPYTVANSLVTLSQFPDLSHGIHVSHNLSGVPIVKLSEWDETMHIAVSGGISALYKNVGTGPKWTGWTMNPIAGSFTIQLMPIVVGTFNAAVYISYHTVPTALNAVSDNPTTPWTSANEQDYFYLDSALSDYAEGEIKRILGYAEWQSCNQNFMAKVNQAKKSLMLDEDTGDIERKQTVEQAKVQLGRN